MYTSQWRERVRNEILSKAQDDERLTGGAITGSASLNKQDDWSDIDLAFGVRNQVAISDVLKSYTDMMYDDYGALHHLDVRSGAWIYRVFLLSNTLQVDIAFVPGEQFGARASTFNLIFGETGKIPFDPKTPLEVYVGYCWLYALHARSSLRRNKIWQAEFFISGMRDHLISLLCRRFGLPEWQGRGVDQLPSEELKKLESTLIKSLDHSDLQRVFSEISKFCIEEIKLADKSLCLKIEPALLELSAL